MLHQNRLRSLFVFRAGGLGISGRGSAYPVHIQRSTGPGRGIFRCGRFVPDGTCLNRFFPAQTLAFQKRIIDSFAEFISDQKYLPPHGTQRNGPCRTGLRGVYGRRRWRQL